MTDSPKPRRRPLSKRIRFEVFKRDQFTCLYCGAHPPAAILHVDHVQPFSKGWTDDLDNLVTACQACNAGKSNHLLSSVPLSLEKKAKLLKEHEAQLAGYRAAMDAVRARENRDIDELEAVFRAAYGNHRFTDSFRTSIRNNFLSKLDFYELKAHAETSCNRMPNIYDATKYFCGMNWRCIKRNQL